MNLKRANLTDIFRVGTRGGNVDYSSPPKQLVSVPPRPMFRQRVPGIKMSSGTGTEIYQTQYIKKLTLDLSVARNIVQFNLTGTILWLYRVYNQVDGSPNTTAFLQMRIADYNADDLTWYAGNGIEGIPYNMIFVTNPATAGVSCEIAYFSDTSEKPVRFF